MNAKQNTFVCEYLIDHNATKAALRAGYSPKNAGKIGYQLLEKTRNVIAQREAEMVNAKSWTADRVLQAIVDIATDLDTAPKDKLRALELIGKYRGMFADKVELSGGLEISAESIKKLADQIHGKDDVERVADELGVRHD